MLKYNRFLGPYALVKLDDSFHLKQPCAVGVGLNCEGTSGQSGALHMGEPQLNNASCDSCAVFRGR